MKEPVRGNNGFWSNFRQGGMPSAIASVMGAPTAQHMAFIRALMKEQRRPEVLFIPLTKLETVVFDLETTGFSCQHGDEILSFGAVRMVGDEIIEGETFYSLVNCRKPVPQHITKLTGITQEMADAAPTLMNGLHDFMSFVGGRVLIAHASAHDKAFLNAALWKTSKTHLSHRVIDTMMIARWLDPAIGNYDLDGLLFDRNIPIIGRHHALEDALMTAELWKSYLVDISKRRVETLGDLYAYLSRS
ncbi:exonuclease domain-containing protein [Paenibacillus crassostreae]|uniref:DNA polymerase III subunit epsilon n=1 Tax=Paenibacillus crassostreae TaxID=1763538 RepID=A0A167FWU1_9BACL|nr:exonuclease domain-containing protein [Paenibacillus crassostreae]AOZ93986.1 DNA polymerase III subunit epsilon [Paenibacillus crassostreae]OAB76979.1 DNA polymerase III subunit epsilon [Paenibacillus crassostreae]